MTTKKQNTAAIPKADDDEADAQLPPVTTIKLDCTDGRGIHYEGWFTFKVPNMKDTMEIGRRKSLLLPISIVNDVNAAMLAEMIAYLDVTLQKGDDGARIPKWWKPLDFYDETPIVALYAEATAYAKTFRGEARPNDRADEEAPAERHEDAGGSDVDGDIQPPIERRTIHRTDSARSTSAGSAGRGIQSGEG